MRGWRIKEDWFFPLLLVYVLGWIPVAITVQSLSTPGGMGSKDAGPLLIVIGAWFAPALLVVAGFLLVYLVRLGFPLERTDKQEIEDLRQTIARLEQELKIGEPL